MVKEERKEMSEESFALVILGGLSKPGEALRYTCF